MSLKAHTVYHVECDMPGCDEGTPDFETIQECKEYTLGEGWNGDTFESYCPEHVTRTEPSKPQESTAEHEPKEEAEPVEQEPKEKANDGKTNADDFNGLESDS